MASFVETTVQELEGRLAAIQSEVASLQAARDALLAVRVGQPDTDGAPSTPTPKRRGRPPASRGKKDRSAEALAQVKAHPGITIPEIADALSIQPNYLYRVMPKLVDEGKIQKQDKGFVSTDA